MMLTKILNKWENLFLFCFHSHEPFICEVFFFYLQLHQTLNIQNLFIQNQQSIELVFHLRHSEPVTTKKFSKLSLLSRLSHNDTNRKYFLLFQIPRGVTSSEMSHLSMLQHVPVFFIPLTIIKFYNIRFLRFWTALKSPNPPF